MKKWLNRIFRVLFILFFGYLIIIVWLVAELFSGNTEVMYKGTLDNSKILIEKNLGNATMAAYMTVYVDNKKVYQEKCFYNDTIKGVIYSKDKGIFQIFIKEHAEDETLGDTITFKIDKSQ